VKVAQYIRDSEVRLGVVHSDAVVDARAALSRSMARRRVREARRLAEVLIPAELNELLAIGPAGQAALREAADFVAEHGPEAVGEGDVTAQSELTWAPAVPRPSKILCVGANNEELLSHTTYAPDHPIYFQKPPSCLIGNGDPIEIPDVGGVHLESELAVVIGRTAKNVAAEDAYDYIFGYTILNDVTAVEIRAVDVIKVGVPMTDEAGNATTEDLQITPMARHKGLDTFAPLGPWVVSRDEIPDPHNLEVKAWMGEHVVNSGNTATLHYHIPRIIEWISTWSTLVPGDIVSVGTAASTDEWPMRDADIGAHGEPVTIEIEGVGTLINPVVNA
jgi:2,4-diketo-3-deoxy-L-fuconate hydrolase